MLDVLCAKIIQRVYSIPRTANPPYPDLSDLGYICKTIIVGTDPVDHNLVPFGIVCAGEYETIVAFRGVEDVEEWVAASKAVLIDSTLGAVKCHDGIYAVWRSLIWNNPKQGVIFTGHSLGAVLATYSAIESGASQLILFATPRPGDITLKQSATQKISTIRSYANPNDIIPTLPPELLGFYHITDLIELSPTLTTPPIAANWLTSHSIDNYTALIGNFETLS